MAECLVELVGSDRLRNMSRLTSPGSLIAGGLIGTRGLIPPATSAVALCLVIGMMVVWSLALKPRESLSARAVDFNDGSSTTRFPAAFCLQIGGRDALRMA
jgi:hypothetical protein